MGVDIFFVLSGFLISYVLKREYDKYGDIDWVYFMKLRFLRIYPGLATFLILAFIFQTIATGSPKAVANYVLPPAFFVNNFMPLKIHKSHLWSIAVEMQFYTVSPYLLKKMLRSEKPWIYPLVAFVFCTTMWFVVLSAVCPEGWSDTKVWNEFNIEDFSKKEADEHCGGKYFGWVYQ
jgi:peptidoglycan/LPS O-acetylase OafA/YrhL